MGLRAQLLHKTGNWLLITGYSDGSNTVDRTVALDCLGDSVPTLMPLVTKCYGTRSPDVCLWTLGRSGLSLAPAVSNWGSPRRRLCLVRRCDWGRRFATKS